jgi:hypothetical protein
LLYAIVLGFVVVTAWQQYDHAQEIVLQEESSIRELFILVSAYAYYPSPPKRRKLIEDAREQQQRELIEDAREQLLMYVYGIRPEWEQMRRLEQLCTINESDYESVDAQRDVCLEGSGGYSVTPSAANNFAAGCVAADILHLSPGSDSGKRTIYEKSIAVVQRFDEARNGRRHQYEGGLQLILWIALLVGGLITVLAGYLSDLSGAAQLRRTIVLSATIGMLLGLSLVFDHPFTGWTRIVPKSLFGNSEIGAAQVSAIWEGPDIYKVPNLGVRWCQF